MRGKEDELSRRLCSLQMKYRELRVHFLALRQYYLLIECAWCKKRLQWQYKRTPMSAETTHSICAPCFAHVPQAP